MLELPTRPIADYGLLGDTRTAALVSTDGAIDWMCAPHFDSEPIFGALVGGARAGSFACGPTAPARLHSRRYLADTATIETMWDVDGARFTLTDGMVAEVSGRLLPPTLLVRQLAAEGAPVDVTIRFDPRRGEDNRAPRASRRGDMLVCTWNALAIALGTDPPIAVEPGRVCSIRVSPERPVTLTLAVAHREPLVYVDAETARDALHNDERRWRHWTDDIDADIPFRDAVVRSLLTLRLLTYSPSGAPVAAPTTSLPESIGGVRNWDYRYAWPRDASLGVGAFLGAGKQREARMFLAWLLHASRLDRPRLPVLLTLHGKHPAPERVLARWPGYAASRPVRVGNGAADQHQLDAYGWVIDAAWLLTRAGHPIYAETWRAMAAFADRVARRWRGADAGIWELRDDAQHHVHSKLMAWLALDRALRIADHRSVSARRRARWQRERGAIADEVRERGYDAELGAYTRAYGSSELDAAVLILPFVGVEPHDSPRVRGTLDAVARKLDAGGPLLYRYPPGHDGLPGGEGAFLPCAFWLVRALAASGRSDEAAVRMADLLALASPLGLFAEEMDPISHEHLGNYPQALTHAALVGAALALR